MLQRQTNMTTEEEINEVMVQWTDEYPIAQPMWSTFKENLQMEVNGTVLRQETTLDRLTEEITRKRSIGDRSITVRQRQDGVENGLAGNELRARYLELTAFNEEWDQLWRPDGSS